MMWTTVCRPAPQPQAGLPDRPHPHTPAPKRPTPARSPPSQTQACCGRPDPRQLLDDETIHSRSPLSDGYQPADHIPAIQWAPVSLGRAVNRRSFPLVAKGRRDSGLGCVTPPGDGTWRRWSWSTARRARARPAARPQSSAGEMPASTGSCPTGVGRKHPVIIRRVQSRLTSSRLACLPLLHATAQHSAGAYTSTRAEAQSADGLAPHPEPTSLRTSAPRVMTLSLSPTRCWR